MPPPQTRRTRRPGLWLVLALSLAIIAAACGGGDSSDASADDLSIEPVDEAADEEQAAEPPSGNGDAAPEITFAYFDGSSGSLDDFAGTPLVVNFFASWCAPCVAELPDLQAVSEEVSGEVAFVGFNVTDQRTDAEELIERTGVSYTIADDPDGEIHRAFRGFAMPTTILISADGTVVRSHAGAVTGEQLRGFIAEDLGV